MYDTAKLVGLDEFKKIAVDYMVKYSHPLTSSEVWDGFLEMLQHNILAASENGVAIPEYVAIDKDGVDIKVTLYDLLSVYGAH